MKRILILITLILITTPAPAAERVKSPGWKRLWMPVVAWKDCPVTPDKFPTPWWTAQHLTHNRITGRY